MVTTKKISCLVQRQRYRLGEGSGGVRDSSSAKQGSFPVIRQFNFQAFGGAAGLDLQMTLLLKGGGVVVEEA